MMKLRSLYFVCLLFLVACVSPCFAGTNPWTATWKMDKQVTGPAQGETIMTTTLTGSVFRLTFPANNQSTEMKLDGTDAPIHTATVTKARGTLSAKRNGPLQILTTKKADGLIVNLGTLTLSADGRTLTEVWWRPETPNIKSTAVFRRQ